MANVSKTQTQQICRWHFCQISICNSFGRQYACQRSRSSHGADGAWESGHRMSLGVLGRCHLLSPTNNSHARKQLVRLIWLIADDQHNVGADFPLWIADNQNCDVSGGRDLCQQQVPQHKIRRLGDERHHRFHRRAIADRNNLIVLNTPELPLCPLVAGLNVPSAVFVGICQPNNRIVQAPASF